MRAAIGAIIRLIRGKRDLSQDALAEASGISRGMLIQIETGRKQPTIPVAERILAAMHAKLEVRSVDEDAGAARRGNGAARRGHRKRGGAVETVVAVRHAAQSHHET